MSQHAAEAASSEAGDATRTLDERLARLPREVGVLLMTMGVLGLALPGLVGTPSLLAGGLMLWPRGFRSLSGWLGRRCPGLHRNGIEQLIRYLDDMEHRYPSSVGSDRTPPPGASS